MRIAIDMYVSGEDGPRGCFTVMTATSEAVFDPAIRELAVTGLTEMDRAFARLFKAAQGEGRTAGLGRSGDAGAAGDRDHPHAGGAGAGADAAQGTRGHRRRVPSL